MQEHNESHQEESSDEEEESVEMDLEPDSDEQETATELSKAEQRADELLEKLMRVQAEFENYRKRMNDRFSEATKYASESILLKVLDIYDNLERALQVNFKDNPEAARTGVEAIEKQMKKLFEQEDVRPIDALNEPFDAYYQHSVAKVCNPEQPEGIVVEVYQKGYMIHDKVLRPALVCVNRQEDPVDNGDSDKEAPEEKGE